MPLNLFVLNDAEFFLLAVDLLVFLRHLLTEVKSFLLTCHR